MAVSSTAAGDARRLGGRSNVPSLQYASFESRVVAGTLDVLVLFIIACLLVTAGSLIVLISSDFERTDPSSMSINIFFGCVGCILPCFLLYFFISLAWRGQTVGAAVMQIIVIRSDGKALGVLGAMARVIALLVYVLIFAGGIIGAILVRHSTAEAAAAVGGACFLAAVGFISAAFDARRRTLHDRIAGTIVVRAA
jgi:uncharacterized RDD family membrane protein YckC